MLPFTRNVFDPMDFTPLEKEKTGLLITDCADKRSFTSQKITITPDKPWPIKLKGNGGFVIELMD